MFALLLISIVIFAVFLWVVGFSICALRALRQQRLACQWDEVEPGVYRTLCDHTFYTDTGGRKVTEWMTYCPYCAGSVTEQQRYTE